MSRRDFRLRGWRLMAGLGVSRIVAGFSQPGAARFAPPPGPQGSAQAVAFPGTWFVNGDRSRDCTIRQYRDALALRNEVGQPTGGSFVRRHLIRTNRNGTRSGAGSAATATGSTGTTAPGGCATWFASGDFDPASLSAPAWRRRLTP